MWNWKEESCFYIVLFLVLPIKVNFTKKNKIKNYKRDAWMVEMK